MIMKLIQYTFLAMAVLFFCLPPGMAQTVIRILPLGNSITRGETDGTISVNQMKGYRYDLQQLLQGAGYFIDYVGSESSGCSVFSDCQHGGIGGSRDQYVARLLLDGYDLRNGVQILVPPRPYLDEYNPDIVLLHIGTNDITHESDPMSIQQISYILDLVDQYETRSNREVIVFLALIINRKKPWVAGSGAATTTAFNNYIKTIAQNRITAGDKIVIVDMENDAGFLYDDTDMADNLHPNANGYAKMATLWNTSITANFNTAPFISPIPDQDLPEGGTSDAVTLDDYVSDVETPDQNILWTFVQSGSSNLDISINANRQVIVIPKDQEWNGSESVVFTATDQGKNGKYVKSFSDTVVFTVTQVDDPPFFTTEPVLAVDKGQQYVYAFNASDIDTSDMLEYSLVDFPSWLILYSTNKLLAGIPDEAGSYGVTLRVSDGQLDVDQSFTVEVKGPSGIEGNAYHGANVIFPNPASGKITLNIKKRSGDLDFILFDLSGKPVLRRIICENCEPEIDLKDPGLSSGLYMYRISGPNLDLRGKLVLKPLQ